MVKCNRKHSKILVWGDNKSGCQEMPATVGEEYSDSVQFPLALLLSVHPLLTVAPQEHSTITG